ncbi:MAG TPA: DUF4928 family protein [Saprospiraceae bacterium]|jgi:hypothetical protein|nr:DUF4928 family protein [Saprospiraceae bacterium]
MNVDNQSNYTLAFEDGWDALQPQIVNDQDFLKAVLLMLDLMKQDKNIDPSRYCDENGNLKSYVELCKYKKLQLDYNPEYPTWKIIHTLLSQAINEGKAGAVAYHLVGATLQLRFPDIEISNESANTDDRPTTRSGDFTVEDTVFYVMVYPMLPVFDKCRANIKNGLRPLLLVPDYSLIGSRQLASESGVERFAVESLESFISLTIERMSAFGVKQLKNSLFNLIYLYNQRVDQAETDKSLMIELPSNLKASNG